VKYISPSDEKHCTMQKWQNSLCYMGFSVFSEVAPSLLIFNTDIFLVTFGQIEKKKQMPKVTATGICERAEQNTYEQIFKICS